jgi:hypothetical protein
MTYGLQREALRFVGEMDPFVFAVFGLVDAPNETGSCPTGERVLASLGDLRARRPSKWPHSQSRPEERWGASRLERRPEKPTDTCIAPLERLRGRSCGAQNEASGWKPRARESCAKAHSSR